MNELIFFLNTVIISGAVSGSIYALGAIGITLVFSILRFAHFAHADMMTLGAFMVLILTTMFPTAGAAIGIPTPILMMPFAMVFTALVAIGLDRMFYRPLRINNVKPIVIVIASLGVTLMLQGLIRMFAGTGARSMYIEERKQIFRIDLPFESVTRPIVVTDPQIWLIVFAVVAVVALHLFLTRTRLGKAMRAMSDNPDLASVSGINTNAVVIVTWVIAGVLATLAGTMLSMDVTLKPDLSFYLLLPMFAAAIVGGVGQPYGAIAGGFLVGYAETISVFNWSIVLRPMADSLPFITEVPRSLALVGTEYKIVVPFVILVVVLIWRPTGLFKGKVL